MIAPNKTAKNPGELPTGMGDGSKNYYSIKSGFALQKCTLKIHNSEKLSVYQNANKQSYVVWSCLRIFLRQVCAAAVFAYVGKALILLIICICKQVYAT